MYLVASAKSAVLVNARSQAQAREAGGRILNARVAIVRPATRDEQVLLAGGKVGVRV